MAVDLPAPGLARRRRAEQAHPIEPFPVFLGLAGDLEDVRVEPHHVARGAIPRGAHGFPHQRERALAPVAVEVGEAHAVTHQPGMNVRPMAPGLGLDREANGRALVRRERREEGARGLHERRERNAGRLARKQPRHDAARAGDPAERLRPRRMDAIEHGPEHPRPHLERPDRRRRHALAQAEVRCLSCHCRPPCRGEYVRLGEKAKCPRVSIRVRNGRESGPP